MILSILIPALNEEKTIGKVIDSFPKKYPNIDKIHVIVVDDGSTDKTSEIAEKKGAIVVKHKKNLKLGPTFRDGVIQALKLKSDILVTIDADQQFSSSEIPLLLKPIINKEADLATGSRFIDPSNPPKNMPGIKKWGNKKIAQIISWATNKNLHDVSCGFRAYSKEALLHLNLFGKFTYTQETILDIAFKGLEIVEVPISVQYYANRKSRIAGSIINYAINSSNIILRTVKDYQPLKFFGYSGLLIFLWGVLFDTFVISFFIQNNTFSPYKILGFLGAFLNATGIMIMFIGILADLIDKIRLNQEKLLYLQKKEYYYGRK